MNILEKYKLDAHNNINSTRPEKLHSKRRGFRVLAALSGGMALACGGIAEGIAANSETSEATLPTEIIVGGTAVAASIILAANVANNLYHSHLATQRMNELATVEA